MKLSAFAIVVLTRAFIGELSEALNVTVTPGPVSMCMEGDNITLTCLVSQRKRSSSVLVLRWLYFPTPEDEHLVGRMGMKKTKYYGNYSKHFPQTKFHLWEAMDRQIYRLLILNVSLKDGGNYTCKVQEIRKHRNNWRASSNGTGSMVLQDLYLCAALICSIGLVCMLVFAMTITCQHLQHRRRLRASYYLVKCPENSSGETVTSVCSSSPAMHRKERRHKPQLRDITEPLPPPQIPAKAPVPRKPRRTKLLKAQPTKRVGMLNFIELILHKSIIFFHTKALKRLSDDDRVS
ncbi:V-set and transmembrane domain-containing protein 4-like isoform X2 [Carassius gibelio]|uniref:V-set and transmembrane domain-containing protein 4-like isoform X2 n=1 Tax=Carassius gibelio TaxID=101364 RepID=UPI0022795BF5|nr:V-set and transmembrane domain-containing protein 4-like isoform X2 [Carassius gibelio]